MTNLTRRQMIAASVASIPMVSAALGQATTAPAPKPVGPLLGHVDHETAIIWFRPISAGQYTAQIIEGATQAKREAVATATVENDLCITWRFDGLRPATDYRYHIAQGEQTLAQGDLFHFTTAPAPAEPARTSLILGSCASSTKFLDIWERIESMKPDGLVLLGDTPYIDTADLKINRDKHREFLSMATLSHLAAHTPMWATWDDHDFGANDSDGRIKGKTTIRKVFTEYRALTNFGDGREGIYTHFRRGPVEVFLIDPRYFSQTEPSPLDANQPSCFGKTQWAWLLEKLKASTATFKILASGMIWDDKKNKEKDDWHTYAHERDALFEYIGKHKIGGVVLIGGDIHVCRHLKYPLTPTVGYDLHQFIISPLHERVIPSLNVPHPNLQWGEPLPNMFLQLVCDTTVTPATLTAKWIDRLGKVHREVNLTTLDLTAR